MDKDHLILQFKRLERHYKLAKEKKDPVSFLDLSHCLRIWVDMKKQVEQFIQESGVILNFPNPQKNKKSKKILKNSQYFDVPLVSVKDTPGVTMKGIRIINRALSSEEIKQLYAMGPPKVKTTSLSFSQWLSSETIYATKKETKQRFGITRELLIDRVANLLGASHPIGMRHEKKDHYERAIDSYIKELHSIKVADGYPLTYYQLIEIAGTIVNQIGKIIAK